ncbi:hypothetical protein DPMN_139307 [Dreissena polymorpha]|uniref:Uncharacterized protein n=1 Tax=Dreissena polymorpha TaxID=45954 RepID=A0A9D4JFJ0_DREPO|nr:hypothetical protein DPMN_139303 [Dreissena polymorpha]KAH3810906.1 hypothetical protein DPMN_139305 [Dreissena polymorpha]KAH3810908.1 hypothetical protein DPMN_139307 [Dreissena polymorpha]
MATKTVIITKTTRTGDDETNVNHIDAHVKKEDFLSRDRNKAGMIALIITTLPGMLCCSVFSGCRR